MTSRLFVTSVVTLLRATLGVIILWLFRDRVLVMWLFFVAAGSDAIDGELARHLEVASRWGEYLDQAADFVLGACGVLVLVVSGWYDMRWLWLIVPPFVVFGYIRFVVPARSPVQQRAGLFGALYLLCMLTMIGVGLASRAYGWHWWYLLTSCVVLAAMGWLKRERLRHWTSVW
jgi:phosphatidylglycerophosphate synthase